MEGYEPDPYVWLGFEVHPNAPTSGLFEAAFEALFARATGVFEHVELVVDNIAYGMYSRQTAHRKCVGRSGIFRPEKPFVWMRAPVAGNFDREAMHAFWAPQVAEKHGYSFLLALGTLVRGRGTYTPDVDPIARDSYICSSWVMAQLRAGSISAPARAIFDASTDYYTPGRMWDDLARSGSYTPMNNAGRVFSVTSGKPPSLQRTHDYLAQQNLVISD
jgi:hypothetical protein